MATRTLGKKNPKPILVPSNNCVPRTIAGNTIMEFKVKGKWHEYFAIGKVVKIYKNDRFDIAYINCGRGYADNKNNIIVYFLNLDSRKQVYTLKVGQHAMFQLYRTTDMSIKQPNKYMVLWAMGIYVPKIVDIRNTELTENEIEIMKDEDIKEGMTFLDMFEKNE